MAARATALHATAAGDSTACSWRARRPVPAAVAKRDTTLETSLEKQLAGGRTAPRGGTLHGREDGAAHVQYIDMKLPVSQTVLAEQKSVSR